MFGPNRYVIPTMLYHWVTFVAKWEKISPRNKISEFSHGLDPNPTLAVNG